MDKIKWIETEKGFIGRLGKYKTFIVFYDSSRPIGDKNKRAYKMKCRLPGIKDDLGNFISAEEAKKFAERVIDKWMENVGMKWEE